jgi:Putative addiction module component
VGAGDKNVNKLAEIREAAMKLPLSDRAELAEELIDSIELPQDEMDELAVVVLRRAEALDRGDTTADGWQESVERVRRELSRRIASEGQG